MMSEAYELQVDKNGVQVINGSNNDHQMMEKGPQAKLDSSPSDNIVANETINNTFQKDVISPSKG